MYTPKVRLTSEVGVVAMSSHEAVVVVPVVGVISTSDIPDGVVSVGVAAGIVPGPSGVVSLVINCAEDGVGGVMTPGGPGGII
jgi:hypothetical protein